MPDERTLQRQETDRPERRGENEERASTPDAWPGIPGRSEESDKGSERSASDVTQQQRELEREVRHSKPE